jgi:hypothetical protein
MLHLSLARVASNRGALPRKRCTRRWRLMQHLSLSEGGIQMWSELTLQLSLINEGGVQTAWEVRCEPRWRSSAPRVLIVQPVRVGKADPPIRRAGGKLAQDLFLVSVIDYGDDHCDVNGAVV